MSRTRITLCIIKSDLQSRVLDIRHSGLLSTRHQQWRSSYKIPPRPLHQLNARVRKHATHTGWIPWNDQVPPDPQQRPLFLPQASSSKCTVNCWREIQNYNSAICAERRGDKKDWIRSIHKLWQNLMASLSPFSRFSTIQSDIIVLNWDPWLFPIEKLLVHFLVNVQEACI